MTRLIINKNVDIYNYPDDFEDNLGSITLGDLHGNSVKLIHFLFRHRIIKFKNEVVNVKDAYQEFVGVYEHYGELLQEYLENRIALYFAEIKITNTEERIARIDNQISSTAKDETQQIQNLNILRQEVFDNLLLALKNKKQLEEKLQEPKNKLHSYLSQFNQFMSQLEINDHNSLIRLIGDELADRGNCDYFTLRILDFLYKNNCNLGIILSNHSCEFIYAYEQFMKDQPFISLGNITENQTSSFWGLKLLMDNDIVSKAELNSLIEQSYKPNLNIIDYSLSDQGITLFSHAPVQFDSIELVARKLGVTYNDSTKEALAETIEQINIRFQIYAKTNSIQSLFKNDTIKDKTNMSEEERAEWPCIYLIWNRWNDSKETETARPAVKNGYSITYVHGHDPYQSKLSHIHNLDTLCGKESRKTENEQINNAFRYLKENYFINKDKTPTEDYLRSVLRYKVFDSDEQKLKLTSGNNAVSECSSDLFEENSSLKKLSLLGGPVLDSSPSILEHVVQAAIIIREAESLIAEPIGTDLSKQINFSTLPIFTNPRGLSTESTKETICIYQSLVH